MRWRVWLDDALETVADIAKGIGFIAGVATIVAIILMGGSLTMFYDIHAVIIYAVASKADSDPAFLDNPYLAANRRVAILLMRETSPIPPQTRP